VPWKAGSNTGNTCMIKVLSSTILGLDAQIVEVEVDLYGGLHSFTIVGLPDKAVEESKERVSSAIKNSSAKYPKKFNKRVTVNLAPANIKKEGVIYDLPIAIGFLAASDQLRANHLEDKLFIGELSLDGRIRPVNGVLAIALMAKEEGIKEMYLPKQNAKEAALVEGVTVYGISTLSQLMLHLEEKTVLPPEPPYKHSFARPKTNLHEIDMAHIKGQHHVKRALEIAAAGAHNILMSGPPGGGKTILSKTLPTILPELQLGEAIEVSRIYSIAGLLPKDSPLVQSRPFRNPHHSASEAAIIGGGTWPRPGEISLAHRGVLFLDEFPEIHRDILESLRQPMEDGMVTISRAQGTIHFPARFMLVAAHNPCPCGYVNDPQKECDCTQAQVTRYQKKISGPISDRIDIHVQVPKVDYDKLASNDLEEASYKIKERVERARSIQHTRFQENTYQQQSIRTNSEMTIPLIKTHCHIDTKSQDLLRNAVNRLALSARSYHKVLKIARTIADLDGDEAIQAPHIAEAIQYRNSSRE